MKSAEKPKKERLHTLDTIRGLAILGMFFIHVSFFIPDILGVDLPYEGSFGYEMFCQAVRITFIFLSGFCCRMSRNPLKRGLIVSLCGLIITVVTLFVNPEEPIIFGVLTLIGASMLLSTLFRNVIRAKNAPAFFFVFLALFLLTVRIHYGYIGIYAHPIVHLPKVWYQAPKPLCYLTAFFGIPGKGFFSSDYFPLIPWFFIFMSGYSLKAWIFEKIKEKKFMKFRWEPVSFMGRYSLWVYFIHLPVILGILYLISYICR
ncbi:MAG: DUF1624 domain-containing protein [Lachnospiraceae bacterium]|nr:DUF1624 domain-containing protein [Lachnospiraceae bacterium]